MTLNKDLENQKTAMKVSYMSIGLNTALSAGKLACGIIGRSQAMISDAVHSLSDVFSTFIVIAGIRLAAKKPDAHHLYGHERLECVAALLLSFLLALVGAGIGLSGLDKIIHYNTAEFQTPTLIAAIAAIVSIAVKEWMFHYTKAAAKKINSDALMADAWHHRSDSLSSIGSLIGITGAILGYPVLDSIAAVIICIFILHAAYSIFMDATDKMVDKACDDKTVLEMTKTVLETEGVLALDDIKTRLFGSKIYVDIEIAADKNLTLEKAHAIAGNVHDKIETNFPDVKHCMVHVNPR